jgi:hypothetical protein
MVRSSLFTLGKFELWIGDRLAPQFDAARFEELARGASTAARQGNRRLIARVLLRRGARPGRSGLKLHVVQVRTGDRFAVAQFRGEAAHALDRSGSAR